MPSSSINSMTASMLDIRWTYAVSAKCPVDHYFVRLILLCAVAFVLVQGGVEAKESNASPELPPHIQIDFDGPFDRKRDGDDYELRNPILLQGGRFGSALELGHEASAVVLRQPISSREGTIAFWVKPAWAKPRPAAQPLLSASWGAPDKSYLVISQGWWEPIGRSRLYFVVSNRDGLHCSVKQELDDATWTLITAVWRDHSCALFLDGVRVAYSVAPGTRAERAQRLIHLGTDAGAEVTAKRMATALMDDLLIFQSVLTDRQVADLHERLSGGREEALRNRWNWLERETAKSVPAGEAAGGELRAIFDESWQWAQSRRTVDSIVQRAVAAGFNVIVPCVWHGAGTYYPSEFPAAPLRRVIDAGFDPLAYLVERAHAAGLEVHPWFTVVRREDESLPRFSGAGVPAGAFDVHNDVFRAFIADLIVDVAKRYPIDGINLDYIRAMGICDSTQCAQQYRLAMGRDLKSDLTQSQVVGPARAALQQWQDIAVTDIVSRISSRARAMRPGILISVDGHPTPSGEVRPLQGRDEIAWARRGLIDIIFHMDYRHRLDLQLIDSVVAELPASTRHVLLVANYDSIEGTAYARPAWVMADLARLIRSRWPQSGMGIHLMAMLTREQADALRKARQRSASSVTRERVPGS